MYKKTKIIALCIPKAYEHTSFIYELNTSLAQFGYRLIIYHTCSDLFWNTEVDMVEKTVFDIIDYDVIDAIIVYSELYYDKSVIQNIIAAAEESGKPIITIGAEDNTHCNVMIDYEHGFELVVRHVIEEHHCTNAHFIAGLKGEYHSDCRIQAFKNVLAQNDIAFSDEMVSYGDYWHEPTKKALHALIQKGSLPDAIICVNDSTAITVCTELQAHGLSVPQDVIVTGFDGTKEAMYHTPPITTCHYDLPMLAQAISKYVRQAFEGIDISGVHTADFTLDIYASCGCEGKLTLPNFGHLARSAEDAFNGYFETQRTLYELTEKAVMCNDAEEIAHQLNKFHFGNCIIFLNQNYFDNTINPLDKDQRQNFDGSACVIYTPSEENISALSVYGRNDIMPYWDIALENNSPIVLSALGFWGNPLGFTVNYSDVTEEEYRKMNQYVTSINIMLGCNQNVRYIQYTAKYMEEMAAHDSMTKIYNRKGFYAALSELVKTAEKDHMLLAVVSVDADNLKYVNDTFGHDNGDYVICTVASALRQLSYPSAIYGRFGGDEFAACIAVNSDVSKDILISQIQNNILLFNKNGGKPFDVSISIGVQICRPDNFEFNAAYNAADIEMYKDKKTKPKKLSR